MADRADLNWEAIAHVVTTAAEQIARMQTVQDDDELHWVDVDTAGLSPIEAQLVESWLHPTLAPRADPISHEPAHRRRRLWNAWARAPRAQLLIASDLLHRHSDVDEADETLTDLAAAAGAILAATPRHTLYRAPLYATALSRLVRKGGRSRAHMAGAPQSTRRMPSAMARATYADSSPRVRYGETEATPSPARTVRSSAQGRQDHQDQ